MKQNEHLNKALAAMLRPLARMLLRNGVSYKAFAELAKRVFVETAREEFRIPGRKQSDSRVSVITGLSRKEVKRVQTEPPREGEGMLRLYNRAARVIYGWVNDPDFQDGNGEPVRLQMESEAGELDFVRLVRRYSGDAPARAVLDELDRVHAVGRHDDGFLSLRIRSYAPPNEMDPKKLDYLGQAGAALVESVDLNWQDSDAAHFHGLTAHSVSAESLAAFRAAAMDKGDKVFQQAEALLPSQKSGSDQEAGVVFFTFER
ncbi:hypothetical protein J2T60_000302 [Natronospira proteinivora]|uniref:Uncharacterized protein n=1 Tax=Natronospira proteinivora TaxID=1807133 RepID=A0ABT1G8Q4_9GAMM|nr:DUF6502 family protein [Natronospira proteinivora]MCP1726337.1 hypothetical protein [Natronospira proteinivora]